MNHEFTMTSAPMFMLTISLPLFVTPFIENDQPGIPSLCLFIYSIFID
jgi:hypothetical protein